MFRTARAMSKKVLHLVRHGQAIHNVRAEPRRAAGCSIEEFRSIMREDDCFDAPLTAIGLQQATIAGALAYQEGSCGSLQLIVSSPLSRALHTADLVFPPGSVPQTCARVCMEHFRERRGMENAQRRRASELRSAFPHWDFCALPEEDEGHNAECITTCAQRAYEGLCMTWARPEKRVAIVAHGGVFMHLLEHHSNVVADAEVRRQFRNCDVRSCEFWVDAEGGGVAGGNMPTVHLKLLSSNAVENFAWRRETFESTSRYASSCL